MRLKPVAASSSTSRPTRSPHKLQPKTSLRIPHAQEPPLLELGSLSCTSLTAHQNQTILLTRPLQRYGNQAASRATNTRSLALLLLAFARTLSATAVGRRTGVRGTATRAVRSRPAAPLRGSAVRASDLLLVFPHGLRNGDRARRRYVKLNKDKSYP